MCGLWIYFKHTMSSDDITLYALCRHLGQFVPNCLQEELSQLSSAITDSHKTANRTSVTNKYKILRLERKGVVQIGSPEVSEFPLDNKNNNKKKDLSIV